MKRKLISKIIALAIVGTVSATIYPTRASASWIKDNQNNYYYTQGNSKLTGWNKINGSTYYFDENGIMKTGWIKIDSSWYYLDNSGVLKTGWINYNNNLYYSDSSGVMQTGVIKIAGKIYIFASNGMIQTGHAIINGTFYTLDSSGAVVSNSTPSPNKQFDQYGNCVSGSTSTTSSVNVPNESTYNEKIVDQSETDDDPNEGRKFKVKFKDSNGETLEEETVKYGHSIKLDEQEKDGYEFVEWNTKSNGKGKSYDSGDDVKIKSDLTLYAIWNEEAETTSVTKISISGDSEVQVGKTIQLSADVLPTDATNTKINWSVTDNGGSATIDSDGILTGVTTGKVTVKATAADGSGVSVSKDISVVAQKTLVTSISIGGNSLAITEDGGTLDISTLLSVLPQDVSNKEVSWSVSKVAENDGDTIGDATISDSGVLTAISDGTIKVIATAKDGSGITGSKFVHISNQSVKLTSVTVRGEDNLKVVNIGDSTHKYSLQMYADLMPTNSDITSTEWSVEDSTTSGSTMTGKATINSSGLLTGTSSGTVKVLAKVTTKSGKVITGSKEISVVQLVTNIDVIGRSVTDQTASSNITTNAGTLQMEATATPTNANTKDVTWSVVENDDKGTATDKATISKSGLLTAVKDGEVLVQATATDGSGVVGTKVIDIDNQLIKVSKLTISGSDNVEIGSDTTSSPVRLQMTALTTPSVVTDSSVEWSVKESSSSGPVDTDKATIDQNGLLTVKSPGTVIVIVRAKDGSDVVATKQIKIIRKVESIVVQGANSSKKVATNGQLQMNAFILPNDANDQTVKWSVVQATTDEISNNSSKLTSNPGVASIDSSGNLTGLVSGEVKVIATSNYDESIKGELLVDVITPVTNIEVQPSLQTITAGNQLQMIANVSSNATQQGVTWSLQGISGDVGQVSISSSGLLTSGSGITSETVVTVIAKAQDGFGAYGTTRITIKPQTT